MRDTLLAQADAQRGTGDFSDVGPMVELEAQYRPQWEQLELQSLANMLGGVGGYEGLLGLYQNQIQPTMSEIEAQASASRTASEQALIEQYGPGITDKLREAAGNKELIGQIMADASGETDPALLNQMVADAENAYGGQNVINQGADVLATAVRPMAEGYIPETPFERGGQMYGGGRPGPTDVDKRSAYMMGDTMVGGGRPGPQVSHSGQGRHNIPFTGEISDDTGDLPASPSYGGNYVEQGRQSLQPSIDAGLLEAGQAELGAGDSEIDAALRARALERMGQGLTEAESRGLQQGQRQAWAARGLGTTLPSAAAEAFYLAKGGEDRQRQNEQFARGVSSELEARRQGRLGAGAGLIGQSYGQRLGAYQTDIGRSTGQQQLDLQAQLANQQAGLTAQEANRQHAFNVAAQNEANRFAQQQANRGYQGNVLGLQQQIRGGQFGRQLGAAQLGQQTSADPFLALFGRPSQAMSQMQGMGSQGYGMTGAIGPRVFQPESQLASDLAMSNYQGQLAANTATGQNRAAVIGGLFQGLGSAICHVAREVYGEENPKWVEFYVWKETKGPRWFKALYNEYSEQWAQFIKDKPTLKAFIKNWMDTKLGSK